MSLTWTRNRRTDVRSLCAAGAAGRCASPLARARTAPRCRDAAALYRAAVLWAAVPSIKQDTFARRNAAGRDTSPRGACRAPLNGRLRRPRADEAGLPPLLQLPQLLQARWRSARGATALPG